MQIISIFYTNLLYNLDMLSLRILPQPDDVTCGPTCLHAVYSFYGDPISLKETIDTVKYLQSGGTLAVNLAIHALRRGYKATIYTYNMNIFDPTWFQNPATDFIAKLQEQRRVKNKIRIQRATACYIEFLRLGGTLKFEDLNVNLIRKFLKKKIPILTGLSATYLYNCAREYTGADDKSIYDDVLGTPMGHFVVISGIHEESNKLMVADPYKENPFVNQSYYLIDARRLINSIMLGIVTYDSNLLIIEPGKK
jgi:hypothetical protein